MRDGTFTSIEGVGHDAFTNGSWVPVRIEVRAEGVTVIYDGAELLIKQAAREPKRGAGAV